METTKSHVVRRWFSTWWGVILYGFVLIVEFRYAADLWVYAAMVSVLALGLFHFLYLLIVSILYAPEDWDNAAFPIILSLSVLLMPAIILAVPFLLAIWVPFTIKKWRRSPGGSMSGIRTVSIVFALILVVISPSPFFELVAAPGQWAEQQREEDAAKAMRETKLAPFLADFAGGSGTEEDPFLISSAAELDAVRNIADMNCHFKQISDIRFVPSDFTSTGGIWKPIGKYPDAFSGKYDGGGFGIYDLALGVGYTIHLNESGKPIKRNNHHIGLFGEVGYATLESIRLEKPTFVDNFDTKVDAGFLAGSVDVGTEIIDCSVDAERMVSNGRTGGLVGVFRGNLIRNCQATIYELRVSGTAGGLVGDAFCSDGIYNSIGKVNMINEGRPGWHFSNNDNLHSFGGLVGELHGKLVRCGSYSTLQLGEGGPDQIYNVGGLVGKTSGTTEDSFAVGGIELPNFANQLNVGGLTGHTMDSSLAFYRFERCFSNVDICSPAGDLWVAESAVGSFIGMLEGASSFPARSCYYAPNETGDIAAIGLYDQTYDSSDIVASGELMPLTDEQMKDPAQFMDFDFEHVWEMGTEEAFGQFPRIRK